MAAYNSAIDNVYNYYLTTYAPKSTTSRYDTHKKSELRGIYNSMLKLNKDTPLYIMDSSKESREFAIGLKEDARMLRNTIASLGGLEEAGAMFKKKSAYSTDEGMVKADFVGDVEEGEEVPPFNIEVTKLASGQENLGYALRSEAGVDLPPDAYSFDIMINDMSYEFQFNVREGDTNRDIQDRLARLITNANVGVRADVLEDGKGSSALRLLSETEGIRNDRTVIFEVSDENSSKSKGAVDYLGIDYVSKEPSNAEFFLNGEMRSTSTNHFTIDKKFEMTLKGVHQYAGQEAEIGIKTDLDSITENVQKLMSGFNSFIDTASTYRQSHPLGGKLMSEMDRLVNYYRNGLNPLGMDVTEDGRIEMDEGRFKGALALDRDYSSLSVVKEFASSVLRKANQISLNPMEYVEKTIVAYKNPGHSFPAPYVGSNYSGMLFNSYC